MLVVVFAVMFVDVVVSVGVVVFVGVVVSVVVVELVVLSYSILRTTGINSSQILEVQAMDSQ